MKNTFKNVLNLFSLLLFITVAACSSGGGGNGNNNQPGSFSIGGTVTGLNSNTSIILKDNGMDLLTVSSNGKFQFSGSIPQDESYVVTIATPPTGETCTVVDGGGTNIVANVSNIQVICSSETVTVSGVVTGLNSGTQIILNNNNDNPITITQNGSFTFTTPIAFNSGYFVAVTSNPIGETCNVVNGRGTDVVTNVTNIQVNCVNNVFTLGGTVTGLDSGAQIVLINQSNGNSIVITGNAKFTFSTLMAFNSNYTVIATNGPTSETCSVSHGIGYGVTSNISNIVVNCSNITYTVGGSVSGLLPGEQITVENNGANPTLVQTNGKFTFSIPITAGSDYLVSNTQPIGEICTATNNNGTVNANINNVTITCHRIRYTVSGSVFDLVYGTQITLLNNGGESVVTLVHNNVNNDTQFSFQVAYASGYNITVGTPPDGESCSVVNGSGNAVVANVSNIAVNCTQNYFSLYSFQGGTTDGSNPGAGLILASDGNFYGTTNSGGAYGKGTIFKITPSGTETLLYSFQGSANNDGSGPVSSLIQATDGNFYGTTYYGGVNGARDYGTIFRFNPNTNVESVIYSFLGELDGANSMAGLIQAGDGYLYGTTSNAGEFSGTVFKINLSGNSFSTIYSFKSANDGTSPSSSLIEGTDGKLYGTTYYGSSTSSGAMSGYGTIFSLTKSGIESILYSFKGNGDGVYPQNGLMQANDGSFYGTVTYNVGNQFIASGNGVVYRLNSGGYSVLHLFKNGGDGNNPTGNLIQGKDNNLYGLTLNGGTAGDGTIYSITLAGQESVLYSFLGANSFDGDGADGTLIQASDGSLYGVTYGGGVADFPQGTVFKFNP